ncbi:thioredoxin-disulfide reductase [Micromonas commoda]|uniref:thioredoxin-disulfide reductase (NADPH) n=1 Tax=Micromonas commoda (strain RCC299 / NOUM17 / CCMP2709) TaxID=296587 RepID=C1FDI0_MICCC|nr:thioredoxin-disulfide reductase [Micromonas commoda]ACO68791.1 thioredoxin-disulfide reductase [Micromonas commoda]|eukprot:XP_002507533.1 thioredoxin-disulfide reductase [Micromonas commoda]
MTPDVHPYDYDLVVIGGGSGGLAAAKQAAKLGAKVACLDFVKPSPRGSTWGLGGTCVNVGCIPKKLMHQAGILGESFSDAKEYGWHVRNDGHDWNKMKNGKIETMTANRILIAVGGRPSYLDVPGAEESLGYDTTVAIRSIPLRGFDTEIAEKIVGYMERHGTKFMRDSQPCAFEKRAGGKIAVKVKNTVFGNEFETEFDTVILAVGRHAVTAGLNLGAAGVRVNPRNGKIPCVDEVTNISHIYAVGDVLDMRQELTPVAIKAGVNLVNRIFSGGKYGCIGMSEELAIETFGDENVEIYQSYFKPLEWAVNHAEHDGVAHREDNACYAKLITNLSDDERVVGFHYVGPNAGEVTQGYAVAMKMGAKKSDFDGTVGIHPTVSEEFTILSITKRSGVDATKRGC